MNIFHACMWMGKCVRRQLEKLLCNHYIHSQQRTLLGIWLKLPEKCRKSRADKRGIESLWQQVEYRKGGKQKRAWVCQCHYAKHLWVYNSFVCIRQNTCSHYTLSTQSDRFRYFWLKSGQCRVWFEWNGHSRWFNDIQIRCNQPNLSVCHLSHSNHGFQLLSNGMWVKM